MVLKMLGIVALSLLILWLWRKVVGDNVTLIEFINRYTFNIIPKTLTIIKTIIGSGFALIYCLGLLVGFSSGFYTLYKGTDYLIDQISWQSTSIKVTGKIIDADNSKNMSEALVRFEDQEGLMHEFLYRANYNGTHFDIGEALPVYYQSENPVKSATLNNKGAYGVIAFLYFYGLAVSSFAIFFIVRVYQGYRRERGEARLEKEGRLITVKVTRLINQGDYLLAEAEYHPVLSNAIYYYVSGRIAVEDVDLNKLVGASAKVKILPSDPSIYLFYTEDLVRLVRFED
ncbi:hypothetical protein MMG00_06560 [Ignatzschineria rhizosphaerae]|uniref:DUF3592 domain-containing protein n=1 Tax=Ignatzschineria rhizosphaerae TaxID=2923279 RepID=A0ABY3X3T0_9GAMM|nr:DUF3592 domain-containing protein [Ignatzschineria rhizosphaerae]UNM97499.1 hypothetical protein MMG00_06560 [Ignatzschineria rhizosphaerae]